VRKKLTVSLDEEVYKGLRLTISPRNISHFIEELVKPHVIHPGLEPGYRAMAQDEAREDEALTWAESTVKDADYEAW
jgi:hypothetical protein